MGRTEYHVHTVASWCAAKEMSLAAIAARARAEGLSRVGLADHLWLDPRRGSRPAVSRLLALREEVGAAGPFLLGAEADCAPLLGLAGGEGVRALDYVIAADHFSEIRQGRAPWPDSPEALAARLADGFRAILAAPAPPPADGPAKIAGHPFFIPPRIYLGLAESVRARIPEAFTILARDAGPLFAEAARQGVAIELNAKALGPRHRDGLLPLFRLAREAGCRFVFSSDAHHLDEVGRSDGLTDYARAAGITQETLAQF